MLALFVFSTPLAFTQVVTGSIVGIVVDTAGSVVPGASVTLTSEASGAGRKVTGDGVGNFEFGALQPGPYTLSVEHTGFKKYERKQISLSANERLSVGTVQLELGSLTESVTVTAEGASLQTATSDRSSVITSTQVENLTVIGREFAALASLLPGVVTNFRSETQGAGSNALFNVQGGRQNANNTLIDGLPSQDLGNAFGVFTFVSMDSVAEVKILTGSLQAEFGRTPGASIQAITKSGTREFHGAAYYYKRHEQFNANDFFNNRNGLQKPLYRFATMGYNIGGPVYIPGKWNRDRNKLFFFFNQEILRETRPQPIQQVTMPTEAERRGDFSNSRDLNGALIAVRDPLSGQSFPGNVVPASRINTAGQNYLKLLPVPNFEVIAITARRYNYQVQQSWDVPKHNEVARVDFALGARTTAYGRFNNWWDRRTGWNAAACAPAWGWFPCSYDNSARSGVLSATHIFSPSLVLELSTGVMRQYESHSANQEDTDRVTRSRASVNIPQFHPENNPLNLVPQASFGGISAAAGVTYEPRFPIRGSDTLFTWSGNLSKTAGTHSLKFGLWAERSRNFEGNSANFAGQIAFDRNVNNPNDSNHPYANALLGNFSSYSESSTRPWVQVRSTLLEWYAQDNWRATRSLTLEYGVRFGWGQPYHSYRREDAAWVPGQWDPAKGVKLIEPARDGTRRVGRHPVTGEIFPLPAIGAIAPGVGDPFNGTVDTRTNRSYPQGLRYNSGLKAAPRLGFAYNVGGKSTTAIRGGWGLFYRIREQSSAALGTWSNPPLRTDPVIYFGNLNTFIGSQGLLFPTATTALTTDWPVARTMSMNFGVQQKIGFGAVLDVAYVGSLGRHQLQGRNLNSIPFGANFKRENQDPTTPGVPLAAAFLRPYVGYNNITLYEYASNTSYHALQATVNRRYAKGLLFGASWTWSKAMDYVDADTNDVSSQINPKVWNYGKANYDRTHVLSTSVVWDIPNGSRSWSNPVSRAVLDHWQLSGIMSFSSGAPLGIGLGFVQAIDITGSPTDGARVVVVEKPTIAKSERTFSRNFNTAAFRAPAVGTFGNAPKDVLRGPGLNNWDLSLFKNFPLHSERRKLQFRAEFYNAFNHTQFSGFDTAARFDAQGNQVNARLGEFTAARAPRRIQLALRFTF